MKIAPVSPQSSLWGNSVPLGCSSMWSWDGLVLVCRAEETEFFPALGSIDSDEQKPHWPPDFQLLFQKVPVSFPKFQASSTSRARFVPLPPPSWFWEQCPGLWCLSRHRVTVQTEIPRLKPLLSVSGAPGISQTGFWSTAPWITTSSMHFNAKLEPQGNRELFPRV